MSRLLPLLIMCCVATASSAAIAQSVPLPAPGTNPVGGAICEIEYTVGSHSGIVQPGTIAEAWCSIEKPGWLVLGGSCSYKHEGPDPAKRMPVGPSEPRMRPVGSVAQYGWLCAAPKAIEGHGIAELQMEARAICGRMCP